MSKVIIIFIGFILSLSAKSQNWEVLQGGILNPWGPRVMYADTTDNYLYVAGMFNNVDNKFIKGIALWDGFQWDSLGAGIDGADTNGNLLPQNTFAITRYNGDLYVGGAFNSVGNVWAAGLARWNGSFWDSLSIKPFISDNWSGSSGVVLALAVINNELYVGGSFDTVTGVPVTGIAKWNGSIWSSLNFPNLQYFSSIFSIAEYNGEIYVAGNFNSAAYPNDTIG
jgi:hypothetical protein